MYMIQIKNFQYQMSVKMVFIWMKIQKNVLKFRSIFVKNKIKVLNVLNVHQHH